METPGIETLLIPAGILRLCTAEGAAAELDIVTEDDIAGELDIRTEGDIAGELDICMEGDIACELELCTEGEPAGVLDVCPGGDMTPLADDQLPAFTTVHNVSSWNLSLITISNLRLPASAIRVHPESAGPWNTTIKASPAVCLFSFFICP